VCGGSFLDTEHPSVVRPVLVVLEGGELTAEDEARLEESKASYGRAR
jgi:hypothetical protein